MRTKKVSKIATLMLIAVMVVSSLYVGKAYAMSWDELNQSIYEESYNLINFLFSLKFY